jgi:hypothetical protein
VIPEAVFKELAIAFLKVRQTEYQQNARFWLRFQVSGDPSIAMDREIGPDVKPVIGLHRDFESRVFQAQERPAIEFAQNLSHGRLKA